MTAATPPAPENMHLLDLPEEILVGILKHLDIVELTTLSITHRVFYALINGPRRKELITSLLLPQVGMPYLYRVFSSSVLTSWEVKLQQLNSRSPK